MKRIYDGILKDDHIDWNKQKPPQEHPLRVRVTVMDEEAETDQNSGERMAEALAALAGQKAFKGIKEPSQWQRKIRKDRPLPNREQ